MDRIRRARVFSQGGAEIEELSRLSPGTSDPGKEPRLSPFFLSLFSSSLFYNSCFESFFSRGPAPCVTSNHGHVKHEYGRYVHGCGHTDLLPVPAVLLGGRWHSHCHCDCSQYIQYISGKATVSPIGAIALIHF